MVLVTLPSCHVLPPGVAWGAAARLDPEIAGEELSQSAATGASACEPVEIGAGVVLDEAR